MRRQLLITFGAGVLLLLLAVLGVYGITTLRMRKTYTLNTRAPLVLLDAASIARGEHLARAIANCTHCHGDDLAGQDYVDGGPLGHLYAPNLTAGRGGVGAVMTDVQWVNAIRHGVGRDGRSLWFMPAETYQVMTDEDLGALIAFLRSLPPVDRELPASHIGFLGRALNLLGKFPFLTAELVRHDRTPATRIQRGVTQEYGYYLARLGACIGCHGTTLSGGRVPAAPPGIPPASNLTPAGIGHYTEADFVRALREGRRPDGSVIDPFMPLSVTRELTDDEIRALWTYLRTVPPREFGNR